MLVLRQEPITPRCIVRARPVGCRQMTDDKGNDDKIIAVPLDVSKHTRVHDVRDLEPHRMHELRQFMLDYKRLENKEVHVERMEGPSTAQRVIRAAVELYQKEFGAYLRERNA